MKEEFLKQRKSGIGGSDVAAILNVSRYKSALDVFKDKTSETISLKGNEATYWGSKLEAVIVDRFVEDTGLNVLRSPEIKRHPNHSWAIANVDGLILDETNKPIAILEIKTANQFLSKKWGEEGSDEVPIEYVAQVQWYMWIYDLPEAHIAALIGGSNYRTFKVYRDDELIEAMVNQCEDFWHNHVLTNTPPAPQNAEDVEKLHPKDNEQSIEADTETIKALNELKDLKTQQKELEKEISDREEYLKIKIGENSAMQLHGTTLYTWKTQETKRFNSSEFKKEHPDLYTQYITVNQYRRLTIK